MSNSFYIVVTSDASTAQYPENKPAKFKMQLLNQQHLSEDWEVAMTHIIYPHTWENLQSQQLSYLLSCNSDSPWTLPIYLPSGIYRTVDDLVNGMVTGLQSVFPDIYLKSGKGSSASVEVTASTFTPQLNITTNSSYLQHFK